MGGGKFLSQWDTALVGLGMCLDPVPERNNPKQGWRMTGSLFRSQQRTSGQSWGFLSDCLRCPPNPRHPGLSFLTHLSSTSAHLRYTGHLSIFLNTLGLAKNQDFFLYNISVPDWILPKGLVLQEGLVGIQQMAGCSFFAPKVLPTPTSPSWPDCGLSLISSVWGRLWACQAEPRDPGSCNGVCNWVFYVGHRS